MSHAIAARPRTQTSPVRIVGTTCAPRRLGCAHPGDNPVSCATYEDPAYGLGCANVVHRLVDKKKTSARAHPTLPLRGGWPAWPGLAWPGLGWAGLGCLGRAGPVWLRYRAPAQPDPQTPGLAAGASSEARVRGIPLTPRASGRTARTWLTPSRFPSKASAEPAMYNRQTLARPGAARPRSSTCGQSLHATPVLSRGPAR